MAEMIAGRVIELICEPGREEIQVRLDAGEAPYIIHAGGKLTMNNIPILMFDVFLAALSIKDKQMFVTLHPRAERYGVSTDAEFVTKG